MNALALLRPPWIASTRSARRLALALVVTLTVAEVVLLTTLAGRPRVIAGAGAWCGAIALWWLLVVPNALWLARDATILQLPRVRRLADGSVLAHALLTVAIPATILALVLGHPLAWYVGFTLAATGCLLFLLLPSGVLIAFWFAFIAVTNLHLVHFQQPGVDRLAWYGVLPTLALVGLTVWQWFRVLGMQAPEGLGLGNPVIWSLRAQATLGFFGPFRRNADAILARGIRPWLAPTPDVRHTGPAHPIRTIRIALGRNVMPQTMSSRLRLSAYSIALVALFLSPTVLEAAHGSVRHVFRALLLPGSGGLALIAIVAAMFPLLAAMIYGWRLPLRWATANADLALLGLLPRLGNADSVRRNTVLACLASALYMGAFEFLLLGAGGVLAGAPATGLLFAALCSAGTVAAAAAPLLRILGGRPMSGWILALLAILTAAVCGIAVSIAFGQGGTGPSRTPYLALALVILLAILGAPARRGWRALQRRPHPFLVVAP